MSELIETSKTLQETIIISSEQKLKIDKLIQHLVQEQEDAGAQDPAEDVVSEENVNEDVAEESSADEEGSADEGGSAEEEEEDESDEEETDSATECE